MTSSPSPTPTLRPQNASSPISVPVADEFPGWGVPPVKNSDDHLRSSWPETEAVLRSLSLYNGIWTDAQTLQHINWTHRVSMNPFFLVWRSKCDAIVFAGQVVFERRSTHFAAQEQSWNPRDLRGLQSVLFASPIHKDPMGQAETARWQRSEDLQRLSCKGKCRRLAQRRHDFMC